MDFPVLAWACKSWRRGGEREGGRES